ncbi:MAG: G5 domain-containing protein [Clostridia bacterium]|nr:G5 domain-containing protein [Clostridia bacterium]
MKKRTIKINFGVAIVSVLIIILITICLIIFLGKNNNDNKQASASNSIEEETKTSPAKKQNAMDIEVPITKQNPLKAVNIEKVIEENEKNIQRETIERQEADVEFNTQYRENNSLAKGKIQTIQEGQDGKQNAIIKNIYRNGELVTSNQISSEITKASIDKIVEIGTAAYSSNYVPIVGDELEVTSLTLAVRISASNDADKLITLNKGDKVKVKEEKDDWYNISYSSYSGWVPKDCLKFVPPNAESDGDENNPQFTKEQLTQDIGFSMLLNRKSGLSIDQYKKIFEDESNDKNNVFKENAEYFYYAEQQYNINGLFVAAIGIHESGWATSTISLSKKNLFGYRAYDRDPYGSASAFENYSEGIDLVARVLVKYYLNPPGTPIYGGETASGAYYKGSTVTAVNKSYATDKNWANAVYKWMLYLYNKL